CSPWRTPSANHDPRTQDDRVNPAHRRRLVGANPNRGRSNHHRGCHHTQLLADRAAIEAADRSTDTVPVDSLQLLDRSAMRGTIAMRIPVWPLIRRAAKLGSRLEGELILEQQDPEHPRGP